MNEPSLRQLRYFTALAETGHFGQAARACNVSQPALSMQIRQFEELLGVQLVERLPGRVALTQAGIGVLRRAEAILEGTRELLDAAHSARGTLVGELRVGVIPTVGPYLLPRALPALAAHFPRLRLRLRESQTAVLTAELAQGKLDICLVALPIGGAEFEERPLFEDRFVLAVPAGTHEHRNIATLDLIRDRQLLLLEEGHCFRDQALSFCGQASPHMIEGFGATSFATILQMVANGYGVTLLPEMAMASEASGRAGIDVMPFAAPQPSRTIGLLWRRSSPRRADHLALGELLTRVARGEDTATAAPALQE